MSPKTVRLLINFWPPLLFSGIRVRSIAKDWSRVDVELRLRWWNRNAVGTMFGGSLFAMIDPFYPLMIQYHLGPGYAVWTKFAEVEFIAPGRGLAHATTELPHDEVERIRAATAGDESYSPSFSTEIEGPGGEVIARVKSIVYVRRKRPPQP
jgi:acyl-coenzyme A thioesterase PaaI-like protein